MKLLVGGARRRRRRHARLFQVYNRLDRAAGGQIPERPRIAWTALLRDVRGRADAAVQCTGLGVSEVTCTQSEHGPGFGYKAE